MQSAPESAGPVPARPPSSPARCAHGVPAGRYCATCALYLPCGDCGGAGSGRVVGGDQDRGEADCSTCTGSGVAPCSCCRERPATTLCAADGDRPWCSTCLADCDVAFGVAS